MKLIKNAKIHGRVIDNETRCIHYQTRADVVAIKFQCCQKFYPCYQCHNESENHPISLWRKTDYQEQAILCGVCKAKLTISEYINAGQCPRCEVIFNSNCLQHFHLYFEI